MKTIINRLFVCFLLLGLIACDGNELFTKEQYKKVICVLSDDDQVFAVEHSLNEEVSKGYVSISCGGSSILDKDVTVEIEPDLELLDEYNRLMFDLDSANFAKMLPSWRYEMPQMSTVLKAGEISSYNLIEVNVRSEGLSPDSIYLIPLKIKSVSDYEVNPDKQNVLYRVFLKNDYAQQKTTTYYSMKGSKTDETLVPVKVSASKIMFPLTKNSVRTLVGIQAFADKKPTLSELKKYAIILEINSDKTVSIHPYGTVDVEMLGEAKDNRYEELNGKQYLMLSYRYRTLESGIPGTISAKYSGWINMQEKCIRN